MKELRQCGYVHVHVPMCMQFWFPKYILFEQHIHIVLILSFFWFCCLIKFLLEYQRLCNVLYVDVHVHVHCMCVLIVHVSVHVRLCICM